jgi:PAS domain S-box-containing protein
MNNILRILFLEDVPADLELAEQELKKEGISFISIQGENEKDLRKAMEEFKPDIIISDYAMPDYTGMRALRTVREEFSETTPFILLTGSMNEETAVECMKAGADDYVIKEHIKRLPFAVKEALRKSKAFKDKESAEILLKENEERLRLALQITRQGLFDFNVQTGAVVQNDELALMLGYDPRDFVESTVGWKERLHPEDGVRVMKALEDYLAGKLDEYDVEFRESKNDGTWIWIHSLGKIIERDKDGRPLRMLGTRSNITEIKETEQALLASIEEKKTLLKELYHRTKNNMQVIAGMLSLQAFYEKDERITKISKKTESRILVMALVHEKLYESHNLSRINLREYVYDLVNLVSTNLLLPAGKVRFDIDIEPIETIIDLAIPIGLVVQELVSNSIQHAFPGERRGVIKIRAQRENNERLEISISDNGIGVGEGFDFRKSETLGSLLIISTVEFQMRGAISFSNREGLTWTFSFPDTIYSERV